MGAVVIANDPSSVVIAISLALPLLCDASAMARELYMIISYICVAQGSFQEVCQGQVRRQEQCDDCRNVNAEWPLDRNDEARRALHQPGPPLYGEANYPHPAPRRPGEDGDCSGDATMQMPRPVAWNEGKHLEKSSKGAVNAGIGREPRRTGRMDKCCHAPPAHTHRPGEGQQCNPVFPNEPVLEREHAYLPGEGKDHARGPEDELHPHQADEGQGEDDPGRVCLMQRRKRDRSPTPRRRRRQRWYEEQRRQANRAKWLKPKERSAPSRAPTVVSTSSTRTFPKALWKRERCEESNRTEIIPDEGDEVTGEPASSSNADRQCQGYRSSIPM